MDEEQDFAYAVSEKALRSIAETAGSRVEDAVSVRCRRASVKGGNVHLRLAVRARYGSNLRAVALAVQQRAAEAVEMMTEPAGLEISVTIEDLLLPET